MPDCEMCKLPAKFNNPVINFGHDPDCFVYLSSGACNCGGRAFWAHKFRCPIPIEGDVAPHA